MRDPWVDPEDRFDPEARLRWQRMEEEGIREYVGMFRRCGILLSLEGAVDDLIDLRETFGPESCPGLLQ